MDQAEPEDQTLHRYFRECCQNPDHYRYDCLSAAGHGEKACADKKVITAVCSTGVGQPYAA